MGSMIEDAKKLLAQLPACANCQHAMDRDHVTVWCRRYPPAMAFVQVGRPSMIALPGGGNQATINGEWIMQFPAMQKTGRCGEWKTKPPEFAEFGLEAVEVT